MNSTITTLFSIPISKIRTNDLLHAIHTSISQKKLLIALPMNIHILTLAACNPSRHAWYKDATYIFADGAPLLWLSKIKNNPLPERVSGTDLVEVLLQKRYRVFLLGSTPDVLLQMKKRFNKNGFTPIVGTYSPAFGPVWNKKELSFIKNLIKKSNAQIVLVGVGHPKQEWWIIKNYKNVPANIFIAVGSAFDILSGNKPRSPQWLQKIGLEWLWRIILEPKRLAFRYIKDAFFLTLLMKKWVALSVCVLLLLIALLQETLFQRPVYYRADPQRSGQYTQNLFFPSPRWWRYKTNGLLTGTPIVANGILYVSSWESGVLFAIDEISGKLLWKFVAQADLPFGPTIYRDNTYIGSVDGHLYALNTKTGALRWKFQTVDRKSITSHPYISGNNVIISSRDGNLYAIDYKTGKESWRFTTGAMNESSPIEHSGSLYFGSFNGKVYAVSAKNGRARWAYQTNGPILSSPAIYDNKLFIGSEDAFVYAIDLRTRKLIWKSQLNGAVDATPALSKSLVFIPSLLDKVYALNIQTGKIVWEKGLATGSHAGFALDNKRAYIGSANGSLYAVNQQNGTILWKYKTTKSITAAPSLAGNNIFVTSAWYVYVLDKSCGTPYVERSTFKMISAPKKN